jgi:YD repeat-containing protein
MGDIFDYDLNDQVMAAKINVANPDTTPIGPQTIHYDANGNRLDFSAYGSPTHTYATNNLNQYSSRTLTPPGTPTNASYDTKGNLTTGVDGSTYQYDSQNRLTSATKSGSTLTFKYDGLNRQVARKIGTNADVYSVWDGWNLV